MTFAAAALRTRFNFFLSRVILSFFHWAFSLLRPFFRIPILRVLKDVNIIQDFDIHVKFTL